MHTIFVSTLSHEREISPLWTKDHGRGDIWRLWHGSSDGGEIACIHRQPNSILRK